MMLLLSLLMMLVGRSVAVGVDGVAAVVVAVVDVVAVGVVVVVAVVSVVVVAVVLLVAFGRWWCFVGVRGGLVLLIVVHCCLCPCNVVCPCFNCWC